MYSVITTVTSCGDHSHHHHHHHHYQASELWAKGMSFSRLMNSRAGLAAAPRCPGQYSAPAKPLACPAQLPPRVVTLLSPGQPSLHIPPGNPPTPHLFPTELDQCHPHPPPGMAPRLKRGRAKSEALRGGALHRTRTAGWASSSPLPHQGSVDKSRPPLQGRHHPSPNQWCPPSA